MDAFYRSIFVIACLTVLAVQVSFVQAQRSTKLLIVRVNGKAGFIDRTGTVVIEPKYEDAYDFSEGLAPIKVDGKWGFINESGRTIVEPRFDWIYWYGFSSGIASAGVDGKRGGIDSNGRFVIEPRYEMAGKFSNGMMPVRLPKGQSDYFEKWIYVDASGKQAINKEFSGAGSFVDGRAFVKVGFDEWALIDKSGNEVTKKHFDSNDPVGVFSDGLTAVKVKDKWGFINKDGECVIKPRFADANNFSEGLAAVKVGCSWGFINTKGELVIPAKFTSAWKFSDGLAPVSISNDPSPGMWLTTIKGRVPICDFGFGPSGNFGYINKSGTLVIPAKFGRGFLFSDGIAEVSFGEPPDVIGYIGKRGYIDRTGKYIWEPTQ
jgi:hypothetical protein